MKVKYVGFGGGYAEYPCYEDENRNLYFDLNNGKGTLNLYTGAYRSSEDDFIEGEPDTSVTEQVECDNPFKRHAREFDYQMLGRLQGDCDYFLGGGYGYEGHLYYKEVNMHCDKMLELYNSFSEEDKPEWITAKQIETYRADMIALKNQKKEKEN